MSRPGSAAAAAGRGSFGSAGNSTPSRRVHGKFSDHEACDQTGSNELATAATSGELHQSCQIASASGSAPFHSTTRERAGVLPPWPLTTRIRRKPWDASESSSSAITRTYVSTRSVTEPGYAANDGVNP